MGQASEFSDVFVSYRRKNVEFTKQLVSALEDTGREIWIDWEDIPPGSVGFSEDIRRGIQGADAVIAILSPDYLESTYCVDLELKYAIELNKRVIPVVYEKFDGYDIPQGIASINWVYFTPHAGHRNTFDEAFPKVIEALEIDQEHMREHKRMLLAALDWDNNDRNHSFLLNGEQITEAEHWLGAAGGKTPVPTQLQQDFIHTSRQVATQTQRRLFAAALVGVVVSLALAVLSFYGFWQAQQAEQEAVRRAVEAESRTALDRIISVANYNPFLAYGLGLELVQAPDVPLDVRGRITDLITTHPALYQYAGHDGFVYGVLLSPDDTLLASAADDGRVILWDIATQEILHDIMPEAPSPSPMFEMAYADDGVTLYVGAGSGAVYAIDTTDGSYEIAFEWEGASVLTLDYSADQGTLAAGDIRGAVIVWDVATGEVVNEWQAAESEIVEVTFNPVDGNQLVTNSQERVTVVWDVENAEPIVMLDDTDNQNSTSAAYSADGELLAIAVYNQVNLYDAVTFELIEMMHGHTQGVVDMQFIRDDTELVTGSYDNTMRRWNVATGQVISTYTGHQDWISQLDISQDETFIVTASYDGTLIYWNLETAGATQTFSQFQYLNVVPHLENQLVAITLDDELVLQDVTTGETLQRASLDGAAPNGLILSPDATQVAITTLERDIVIWNLADWSATQRIATEIEDFDEISFNADGSMVIATGLEAGLFAWEVETGAVVTSIPMETIELVGGLHPVPGDPAMMLVGDESGQLMQWDIASGADGFTILGETLTPISDLVFSPDETLLATGEWNGSIILWDTTTWEPQRILDAHDGLTYTISFSPDSSSLLSGGVDGNIFLWDVASGEPLRTFSGHLDWVTHIDWLPNGFEAISNSFDGTARQWQVLLPVDQLVAQAETTRSVQQVTCSDLILYDIPVECEPTN